VAALSDDIAYVNHDLHDGLRAGVLKEADLVDVPLVGPCFAEVTAKWPGLELSRLRHEALRRVFGQMVEDVMTQSRARLAYAAPQSMADVQALPHAVIAFSEPMLATVREIKDFLFARMYRHYRVKRMRAKAVEVVRDLFTIFLADPGLLPPEWESAVRAASNETLQARVIADYIAGMTDRFALEEHRVLTDPLARA